jgi:hypothetical protein
MANETTLNFRLSVTKGPLSVSKALSKQTDMDGTNYCARTMTVTSLAEHLDVSPEILEFGWAWFQNQSDTETVEVGILADVEPVEYGGSWFAFMSLAPGEANAVPLFTTPALGARSTGADAVLEYVILER